MTNSVFLLIASTISQTVSNTSEWDMPNVVDISCEAPPAKYRRAPARRTVKKLGPLELALAKFRKGENG